MRLKFPFLTSVSTSKVCLSLSFSDLLSIKSTNAGFYRMIIYILAISLIYQDLLACVFVSLGLSLTPATIHHIILSSNRILVFLSFLLVTNLNFWPFDLMHTIGTSNESLSFSLFLFKLLLYLIIQLNSQSQRLCECLCVCVRL